MHIACSNVSTRASLEEWGEGLLLTMCVCVERRDNERLACPSKCSTYPADVWLCYVVREWQERVAT